MQGFISLGKANDREGFPSHDHSTHWEIMCYTKGKGILVIDNVEFKFQPGDIFFIPPYKMHSEICIEPYDNYYLWVRESDETMYSRYKDYGELSELLRQMYNLYHTKKEYKLNIILPLFDAFRQYILEQKNNPNVFDPHVNSLIYLLLDNLANSNFDLGEEVKKLPMSEVHLRRLFKEQTEMSPIQYLNQKRIDKAKFLIRQSYPHSFRINEIALICGFADPYYFSRMFKKLTSETPLEYAKRKKSL